MEEIKLGRRQLEAICASIIAGGIMANANCTKMADNEVADVAINTAVIIINASEEPYA